MSDDQPWEVEETKPEVASEPAKEEGRGGRGRGKGQEEVKADDPGKSEQKQKAEEEKEEEKEESQNWASEQNDKVDVKIPEKDQNSGKEKVSRNQMSASVEEEVSQVINPKQVQLQKEQNQSSWMNQPSNREEEPKQETNERGNRGRGNRDDGGENSEGRGNRGNRDYNRPRGGGGDFRGNREEGGRDFRGNREQGRGGYRGNREGGGFRGNQEQGGRYRGNREQGGFRGNRQNGGFRGNKEDGENGGYRGNRGENGNFRNNREGGDFRRNKQDGEFNKNGGRENRGYRNDRGDRPWDKNGSSNNQNLGTVVNQNVVKMPGGKAWPSCELFIMGNKLSVTLKILQDFNSKVLIVPYCSLLFEYDPGNYVIKSKADYRSKLKAKGEEVAKPGKVYFQKAIQLDKFKALGFLKVDNSDESKLKTSLEDGIELIMKNLGGIKGEDKLDSVVFPLCQKLCDPEIIIHAFATQMETSSQIKEVFLSVKDPKFFLKCIEGFQKTISGMIETNEISYE